MPAPLKALDLFAGTGWGVACRWLGIDESGVELMDEAVATRTANGMHTIYRDVWDGLEGRAEVPQYDILIASPPCQTFSMAGKGAGRAALDEVLDAIKYYLYKDPNQLREFGEKHDPRTALVLTPLAHIWNDLPQYVVLEQVPTVQPVWEAYAEVMRTWGYSVETAILNAEQYGIVSPCAMHSPTENAPNAGPNYQIATARAYVGGGATTPSDSDGIALARAVVGHWVAGTSPAGARVATWLEPAQQEAMKADWAAKIRLGKAEHSWTTAATSVFGLTAATAESIELSWNESLADLSLAERWSTMSMEAQATTIRATLSSIVATRTTCTGTGQGKRHEDCGLCLDTAVPQTRRRSILVARLDGPVSLPKPTHSRYYNRNPSKLDAGVLPWVSMAEALGWGRTDAPSHTITGGTHGPTDRWASGGNSVRKQMDAKIGGPDWKNREGTPEATGRTEYADRFDVAEVAALQSYPAELRQPIQDWKWKDAPATTIAGDPRITAREHHYHGEQSKTSPRLTQEEATVLQTFPSAPFVWCGTKSKVFLQIGNAVPPVLAAAVLSALIAPQQVPEPENLFDLI